MDATPTGLTGPGPPYTTLRDSTVRVSCVTGAADDEGMGASVVRWRRYGKDRLYVNGPAGERYGWGDVDTGVIDVSDDRYRDLVEALLREHPAWRHQEDATLPTDPQAPSAPLLGGSAVDDSCSVVSPGTVERPWVDLALNRPGEAARARAVELRQAAPVRTALARVFGVHTDERAWRIGADGEESVARTLSKLGEGWRCLHFCPGGQAGRGHRSRADGPGGVFTINAKHHPGARAWVGGDTTIVGQTRVPYVRDARSRAPCEPASHSEAGSMCP